MFIFRVNTFMSKYGIIKSLEDVLGRSTSLYEYKNT